MSRSIFLLLAGCDLGSLAYDSATDDDSGRPDGDSGAADTATADTGGGPPSYTCGTGDIRVPDDYATITAAIAAAAHGDGICVAPGTWTGTIDLGSKDIHLYRAAGPEATVLEVTGSGSVVVMDSGEGPGSILEGFTLTGGTGTIMGVAIGGGILLDRTSPTLMNLVITGNTSNSGGGIAVLDSSPLLENVRIQGNTASTTGGGIYVYNFEYSGWDTPVFRDVLVSGNSASLAGGGIYLYNGLPTWESVRVEDNFSGQDGGGIYIGRCHADITNLVVAGNEAGEDGGGIMALHGAVLTIENATLAGNTAQRGGGWFFPDVADLRLSNMLLVSNSATEGGGFFSEGYDAGSGLELPSISIQYSSLYGNTPDDFDGELTLSPVGTDGNVATDPVFVSTSGSLASTWDLHATALFDDGDPSILDPDGSTSAMGAYGGLGAESWDFDADGWPEWWQPTAWDPTYASSGWDCDDRDANAIPGDGC